MAAWEFQMLNNAAEKNGWHKFISMQNYHDLLYREEEREMHPYCEYAGIGPIPWSPLAQGILARPWDEKMATKRAKENQYLPMILSDSDKPVVDKLEEVSKRLGMSMAVAAGAWSLSKGVNPILGLSSKERIDEAVGMVNLKLDSEDVKALDEVYVAKAPKPVY